MNNLVNLIPELSNSLKAIQPKDSENEISSVKQITQTITYTLLATAVVGIAVYHYIKQAEKREDN